MNVTQRAESFIRQKDWARLSQLSQQLIKTDDQQAYGYYLLGIVNKSRGQMKLALDAFLTSLKIERANSLVSVEVAEILQRMGRHGEAVIRLRSLEQSLPASLSSKVGEIYTRAGLHLKAAELLEQAYRSDPNAPVNQMNLASNLAKRGEIKESSRIYKALLSKFPEHQRLHYDFAKLCKSNDDCHFNQMKDVLDRQTNPDSQNIFLLFALGKVAEDLDRHDAAFSFYSRGNEAASEVATRHGYSVDDDISVLEAITSSFIPDRLSGFRAVKTEITPAFIVGLPRSGTTLTEKILTGHVDIESIDESFFLENSVKTHCGLAPPQPFSPAIIEKLSTDKTTASILESYIAQTAYRRSGSKFFIEKYPLNVLFAGLIARHLPQARIICLLRNPMDVCMALFKQPHFRFSFKLEDLARYYSAFYKLAEHWRERLGSQIHFVKYEELVYRPEKTTKDLMGYMGLDYSSDLLNFHERRDISASASSSQIREKLYSRSIGKWKVWKNELAPLSAELERNGINLSSAE